MKKIFLKTKMTWAKVIITAIITAVISATVLLVPIFENTSFHNIGVCFEFWFIPAMFVALNCKKILEAGIKTFVFFLISQPLIYLIQVPFSDMGFGLFSYYKYWAYWTIISFFLGMVAYLGKKKGWLGVAVAFFANLFLVFVEFISHLKSLLGGSFPNQTIACAFIVFELFLMIYLYTQKKSQKILSVILTFILIISGLFLQTDLIISHEKSTSTVLDGENYYIEKSDEGITVEIDKKMMKVTAQKNGKYEIILKNEEGKTVTYTYTFDKNGVSIE